MNTATHCNQCRKVLGESRYIVSPSTGGICYNKAWCPDCYEILQNMATKHRVEHYAEIKEEDDE